MIRHIVFWTLSGDTDAEIAANARTIIAASGELKTIPGVLSVELSADIQPTSTVPARIVLQSSHPDAEALAAYAVHPTHVAFAGVIKKYATSRQALDYIVE